MESIKFDLTLETGAFKPLNATSGGPWHKRYANDQPRTNFKDYKAARIPYSRNHDSWGHDIYGGPFSHDISAIFPNFDADVNDPASYDFACTDEDILTTLEAGTQIFFRLGETIDHRIVKHNIFVPKDLKKWAEICEHIIRHYNEGWANGYELNIKYWEIWCEPDLDKPESTHKRLWTGTPEEFYDMYEIAAKHLKNLFPNLKIGGASFCPNFDWVEAFLCEMQKRNVPIDFLSWHAYCHEPVETTIRGKIARKLLEKYGYGDAESILNEFNYMRHWHDAFIYSLKAIQGAKGAAFLMSSICECQNNDVIDMFMYYSTMPNCFNGIFNVITAEPLKGYYALYWYGMFYDMETCVKCTKTPENVYGICGVDKDGKVMAIVSHYSENDETAAIDVSVDLGKEGKYEIYRVDNDHDGEKVDTTSNLEFNLPVHSFILIKEI